MAAAQTMAQTPRLSIEVTDTMISTDKNNLLLGEGVASERPMMARVNSTYSLLLCRGAICAILSICVVCKSLGLLASQTACAVHTAILQSPA